MQAGAANTAIKPRAQCCHGVDIGPKDEGLDHRARFAVSASVGYAISDDDNGRAV
jgi:hypothetical protein